MWRKQDGKVHDMLVVKYEKKDNMCFISHIDLLKHVARIIRRANIPVKFSQGFNPHTLVYFSPPSVLGASSKAEYVAIDTDMQGDVAFEKFASACPSGMVATDFFVCEKNPNIQGLAVCADYLFDAPFCDINFKDGFEIEYTKKGEVFKEDVANKIFGVKNCNSQLCMCLASGNTNLRPDRLLDTLSKIVRQEVSLVGVSKIAQYVKVENEIVNVDDYLAKLQNDYLNKQN